MVPDQGLKDHGRDSHASSAGERSAASDPAESVRGPRYHFTTCCTECAALFDAHDYSRACPRCGAPWRPCPAPEGTLDILGMRRRLPSVGMDDQVYSESDVLEALRRSGLGFVATHLLIESLARVRQERDGGREE